MRFVLTTLWTLVFGAITAGVYWTFLITPESTVWTLAASGLLAVAALVLAGFTVSGAIAMLRFGPSIAVMRRALPGVAGVIPAAGIVFMVWWIVNRAEAWLTLRHGQISAWFIARLGWSEISWLFTTIHFVAEWFRWVVAAMLALSLIAGFLAVGWSALGQAAWLRRALHPRALLVATLWFVALVALPWTYLVPWRPKQLPASSVEFAFIIAKLSVAAILFAVAAALMAHEASRPPKTPSDPSAGAIAA